MVAGAYYLLIYRMCASDDGDSIRSDHAAVMT